MARPRNKRPISVAVTKSDYDGKWHAYITVGRKPNGKPDIKHRSGRTREECEDKIRAIEDALAAGRKPDTRHAPTLAEYLTQWLDESTRAGRWKYLTQRDYSTVIRTHLIPHLGGHRLDALAVSDVKHMLTTVNETKGANVAAKAHRVLRSALSDAAREELVPRNVAKLVRPPTPVEEDIEPLTVDEVKAILKAIEHRRNRARWLVAVSMGQRQGECLGLAWHRPDTPRKIGDIDLANGTITIREKLLRKTWEHGCDDPHACGARPRPGKPNGLHRPVVAACPGTGERHRRYHRRGCPPPPKPCPPDCDGHARACPQRKGGGLQTERPKSRAGERTVAMPGPVLEAFRQRKVEQEAEREAAGELWVETGLVFTTPLGRPIDPRADYEEWQKILAEAGVAPARLHAARHSAATFLLVQGVDKRVVMEIMGWSQESMLRRYQKVVDELKRDAAKRMGALLWGKKEKKGKKKKRKKGRDPDSSTDLATG